MSKSIVMTSSTHTTAIGILGTADIANNFMAEAKGLSPRVSVVAIGSRTLERARQFASKWVIPRAYGTYQQVLDDPEVKLVYIPLPTTLHKEWTIKCARKGKHVICEKPIAPTYEDTLEMVQECIKNNVQFMDGTYWTHSPRTRTMQAHFPELGEVRSVMSKFTALLTNPNDIRLSVSTEPLGVLGDLGWYCIRGILFGFDYELPDSVFGVSHCSSPSQPNNSFTGTLTYADGRQGHFSCSFLECMTQHLELGGPLGSMWVNDFVLPWSSPSFGRGGTGLVTHFQTMKYPGLAKEEVVTSGTTQVQEMIIDMCNIVREGRLQPFWWEVSLKTQMLLYLLLQSSIMKKPVQVPKTKL